MRKTLISAALIAATAVAMPASAQYYPNSNRPGHSYGYGNRNLGQQLRELRIRIERAEDRDRLSNRERDRLLRQVYQTDRLLARYRYDGLAQWETRDIQNRIHNIRQHLRHERQEDRWDDRGDRRDDRRDRWDDDND